MLRVRSGAVFTCHGDGLCCTDLHALGPLEDDETEMLGLIDERLVLSSAEGERVIATKANGECALLSGEGCALHARLGPSAKPQGCRQFPFLTVATPTHRRVATVHRCPCRTMGERAPITSSDAEEICGERAERTLQSGFRVDADTVVAVEEYERLEGPLLERILSEDPLEVLGTPAMPSTARTLAEKYAIETGATRSERAIVHFGRALLCELGGDPEEPSPIPWDDAFDRAEARSEPGDPEAMLRDFVADYVWSLEHAFLGTWAETKLELGLRIRVARRLFRKRTTAGRRADRAMAEAIAICELAGIAEDYMPTLFGRH
ncbi:MAG: hypothetical protein AAGF12_31390 [Myxococcota bacterium]